MRANVLAAGTIVGGYRVGDLLRRQEGVQVYAARSHGAQPSGPLTLALIEGEDASTIGRFAERAERLKHVHHHGVARVYDVGRHGVDLFVARERVGGLDLGSIVERRGRLELGPAIEILAQTAAALAALREQGVDEGALTIRNVLVARELSQPQVQLAEVGILPGAAASGSLAPEVAAGGDCDPRADVYSLGAVLLSELTGARPGDDAQAVLRTHRRALPGALDVVLEQALDADPSHRFDSGGELLNAVRRAARDAPLRRLPTRKAPASGGGGPPTPPQGPSGDGGDPPDAYALLRAPSAVLVGQAFDVEVGLSEEPEPDAPEAERLRRPAGSHGPYTLTVTIEAQPDFEPAEGQSLRVPLEVTASEPHPTATVRLVAKRIDRRWKASLIHATYATAGETMGIATRPIGIASTPDLLEEAQPREAPEASAVASGRWRAPDLTVNVLPSPDPSVVFWNYDSPHPLELPTAGHECRLGSAPQDFAREVIGEIPQQDPDELPDYLRGAGQDIAEVVPVGFWPLLTAVAQAAGDVPTLLINSRDPYVPWELALVPQPLDPAKPAFLACQAIVGRWIPGNLHPPPRPPAGRAPAEQMVVVSGRYDDPTLPRLTEAEREAKELVKTYGADPVDALKRPVRRCLKSPTADILHFSMHARGDADGLHNGLVMIDRTTLGTTTIAGTELEPAPFVFLNACEAASGRRLLGSSASVAAAFLRGGAAAVVAPLWKIHDRVAHDIATRFYAEVFKDGGVQVADFLRIERANGAEPESIAATTHLAYVFYGHPRMHLEGPPSGRCG
jgi:hypothetical protein